MKRKGKKILFIVSGILLGLMLGAGSVAYYFLFKPQFYPDKNIYIYVDSDDTADSIIHKVCSLDAARRCEGFQWLSRLKSLEANVHTGRYVVRPGDNIYNVYSRISRGHQQPVNVVVHSVRTLEQLAGSIGKQLMTDSADIMNLLSDTAFTRELGYDEAAVPCLFLPDTYQVYWNISAKAFLLRMQKEYKRFWNAERMEKVREMGMTPIAVATLASIVDEETNDNAEKPIVAGLYINRLKANMPLQADPTVKFALGDFAIRRVTNADLQVQSPYNTYINAGLPPGPIRIPSKQGIESVLNYAHHNFLYMCAKEDFSGTHNFASNYADHLENARKYRNALNKIKIFG